MKQTCIRDPFLTIDVQIYTEEGLNAVAVNMDGRICYLTPEAAMSLSNALNNASREILDQEAAGRIERPEYWQDYLLEAKHMNVSTSRLQIENDIWVVDHDSIREFIEDYTMDNYSQFYTNLSEMAANGLISKES